MHVRARARVLVVTKLECEIEQPCTHRYGRALVGRDMIWPKQETCWFVTVTSSQSMWGAAAERFPEPCLCATCYL